MGGLRLAMAARMQPEKESGMAGVELRVRSGVEGQRLTTGDARESARRFGLWDGGGSDGGWCCRSGSSKKLSTHANAGVCGWHQ